MGFGCCRGGMTLCGSRLAGGGVGRVAFSCLSLCLSVVCCAAPYRVLSRGVDDGGAETADVSKSQEILVRA